MSWRRREWIGVLAFLLLVLGPLALGGQARREMAPPSEEEKILAVMHAISSETLQAYVQELCLPKYGGRLTGTEEYRQAAAWVIERLKNWSIRPGGEGGTYFQQFPDPYTLVLKAGELVLHLPLKNGAEVKKTYEFEKDYIPGSTSDSGAVTAEVIYVGYGITAPELGYDDYRGMDVRGKIVMMEPEVPVSPDREPQLFKAWRPYSFHQYKFQNARDHAAAGILYNYPIANPNAPFIKGLLESAVGPSVIQDIFAGTGRQYSRVVEAIQKLRRPQSFRTGKTVTLRNDTEHHPEGIGFNVIGRIEGSDPELKREALIIGAHLDHLGRNHEMMPGANDNASGVAVVLGAAEALARSPLPLKRSVLFIFFGAEEQGVLGSEFYVKHPVVANERVVGFINLDGVGRGDRLLALAGVNFPKLWAPFEKANKGYIHRVLLPVYFANLARQRLDAAHFLWAGVPTLSFNTLDTQPLPYSTYHSTRDRPELLTPEIMEDLARLIYLAVLDIAR